MTARNSPTRPPKPAPADAVRANGRHRSVPGLKGEGGPVSEAAGAVDGGELASLHAKLDALLEALSAPPQRFLSVKSAAVYADVSADTIRRLIERGELEPYRPVRGKLLVDRQQLDRLILGSVQHRRPQNGRGTSPRQRGENGRFG